MANGVEVARAYVTIIPTMEGSQQTITREMTEAASPAGDAAGKAAGSSFLQSFSSAAESAGKRLTATVTAPIVAAGTTAAKKAADYQTALAKVATIADPSVMGISEMDAAIMQLSADTGVAAANIAESVYGAISAGQDTAEAVDFVRQSINLSKGGFTDTAKATDVLTTALNAYGLAAAETEHISDILIGTQNLGKTTVDELASNIGRVIPTAKAAGVGLEDLATQYVALTKNGIATAEATTYINGMLNELNKSGTKVDKVFRKITKQSFRDFTEGGGSVAEAIKLLDTYAQDAGLSLGDLFGSAEAAKAANVISTYGDAALTLEQLTHAADITDRAVQTIDSTPAAKLARAQNDINNALIKLGEDILPIVVPIVEEVGDAAEGLADKWDTLSRGTQNTIIKLAGIAALAGPALIILSKLAIAANILGISLGRAGGIFGRMTGAFGRFGRSASATAEPTQAVSGNFATLAGQGLKLVAAAAGFVGVALGMTLIARAAIEVGKAGPDAWISLGIITGAILAMVGAAVLAGPALTANAVGIGVFGLAVAGIGVAIAMAAPAIGELIGAAGMASVYFADAAEVIGGVFVDATNAVAGGIDTVVTSISGGLTSVLGAVADIINGLGDSALKAGQGFGLLADGVVALTTQTGALDLGATLTAVAAGVGAIMAEAALGGEALQNVSNLGVAFTDLATDTDNGVNRTIASVTRLQDFLRGVKFTIPSTITIPSVSAKTQDTQRRPRGVRWYDKGGIFTEPAVIGVAERRPEVVGALDDLRGIIRSETAANSRTINHTGTIRVEGYNDRGQLDAVVDNLVDRLRAEVRLA